MEQTVAWISLVGSVVSLAAVVIGIAVVWGRMQEQISTLRYDLNGVKSDRAQCIRDHRLKDDATREAIIQLERTMRDGFEEIRTSLGITQQQLRDLKENAGGAP